MPDGALPSQPAKPGTACLTCRTRKLKCSRGENGCTNCLKSDLPCVYPQPETGVKRKRGPYKKDKPPRERHLEDLVKYLEPKVVNVSSSGVVSSSISGAPYRGFATEASRIASSSPIGSSTDQGRYDPSFIARVRNGEDRGPSDPEALVKDALIALTQSSLADREAHAERVLLPSHGATETPQTPGMLGVHPPTRVVFEHWQLFSQRVDPLLKLVHAPTVLKKIISVISDIQNAERGMQTLLFGIYYSSVSTCTAMEARERFSESRATLLERYGKTIEANLSDMYHVPPLEALQGLLLYLKCIQRQETKTNLRSLFSMGVRMAQLTGMNRDPGEDFSPYDAEMRRRAWWHLCGLESRGVEEGEGRTTTIMDDQNVRFPTNFNDNDIDPLLGERPEPRYGVTDMTYPLLRFEIVYLSFMMWAIRRECRQHPDRDHKAEQHRRLQDAERRIEEQYFRYLHPSRVYDWMCLDFMDALLTKHRLMIDYPLGHMPPTDMAEEDRMDILQASVKVIHLTYTAAHDPRLADWRWFYRGWVQWHSLALVIVELTRSTNSKFAEGAWNVLDPILAEWDRLYPAKKGEPSWEHVHAVVERARQMRQSSQRSSTQSFSTSASRSSSYQDLAPAQQPRHPIVPPSSHTRVPPSDNGSINTGVPPIPTTTTAAAAISPRPPITSYPLEMPHAHSSQQLETGRPWEGGLDNIDYSAFDNVFGDMAWSNLDTQLHAGMLPDMRFAAL